MNHLIKIINSMMTTIAMIAMMIIHKFIPEKKLLLLLSPPPLLLLVGVKVHVVYDEGLKVRFVELPPTATFTLLQTCTLSAEQGGKSLGTR